jgi:hypothetical protein
VATTENRKIITLLEPNDEYSHEPGDEVNYNESMYLNGFDLERQTGAWFRIGNRVNEGYAEMTVCIYLPGGRVAFLYKRPEISSNDELRAGGLNIEVIEPLEHLRVTFSGRLCLLDDPSQMANPREAFRNNPMVESEVTLDFRGVAPVTGGRWVYEDGSEIEQDAETSFYKAHYEQHVAVNGSILVGEEAFELDGFGLRDKSWGPRYWQAMSWYRWLPMIFGPDFAMMLSIVHRDADPKAPSHRGGVVMHDGEYEKITDCKIESDYDDRGYQTAIRCWAKTDRREYEVVGEPLSLIPLRNRRTTPAGDELETRITEAMTRFRCDDRTGMGMSEYLDQLIDGEPNGVAAGQ